MRIRTARLWGAVAALSALLVGASATVPASALVAPAGDETATIADERAIIRWDGSREEIEFSLDLDATAKSAGLIFPTPSPAKVTASDEATFAAVEKFAAPRTVLVNDWWGFGVEGEDRDATDPVVLERVRLGSLEATTLRASNVSGMTAWLKENDFSLPKGGRDALKNYVKKGWSFVAIKLVDEKGLAGELDPIHLSFDTDELVYPVRLGMNAPGPTSLRLYVFEKQRMVLRQVENTNRPVNAAQTTAWAGKVDDPSIAKFGPYLTVFDLVFDSPSLQLTSDIVAVPALADDEVIPTVITANPMLLLGIPTGLLVAGWGGFGLILALAFVISRVRSR